MGKKKCSNCGEMKKQTWSQKGKRVGLMDSVKLIRVAGIKELDEETKDFCYDCWEKRFKSHMKPFAQMLGKSAEDW